MRNVLAATIVTLSVFTAVSVTAGPITGTSAPIVAAGDGTVPTEVSRDSERDAAPPSAHMSALSDFRGLPLMFIAPPQVLFLDSRAKLRAQGPAVSFDSSSSGSGGGPSISNVGFQPGSDNAGPPLIIPGRAVPEPAALLLIVPGLVLALRRWNQRASGRSAGAP